ncbi:hypothetical protein N9K55_02705 [Candidatus Pelagibacter bacterium]|nr:hypothetical protein [Candidatus Pelagibacter bacterium]
MNKNKNLIYSNNHLKMIDRIIVKKRLEIVKIINNQIKEHGIKEVLDIGTTADMENESSNLIAKKLEGVNYFKSISDQEINSPFFKKKLKKSITEKFSEEEIKEFSSDLVISNATLEHVGNFLEQKKMVSNIINLSKKLFIISTPNRFYPIDFHTKLPLIHWLPKSVHRKILNFLGMHFYEKEENLNLLGLNEIKNLLDIKDISYKIASIKLLFFKSNFVVIGKKNN